MSGRYVALGSSMAAGPGIRPKADGAPAGSGRSAVNYPHLVARRLGHHLVDVTFSGATTAHVLTERQRHAQPQIDAIDGSEDLVTITIGGNDAGYVPMLYAAGLPRLLRSLPVVGSKLRELLDPAARDTALAQVADSLITVGREVRRRAPRARVLFVDYLTLLPPPGTSAPFPSADLAAARHVADTLKRHTEAAAAATGCELVRAADASVDHHPWSNDPWTSGLGLPLPGRPAPLHPNAAGMRAVADLVVAALT
ncbi:SGNH/GDSL hydrolase family protein [Mycobacterium sp. URHB0044]|uniref:SGNH/GDSL hydrolase family protein n=1 Tax=Mycobacterium sp. URHB0044 TaxID=1380386 RepID=UPI00048E0A6E|nr:SGNH/GDSL hydrolase family protein [Mycobacterium sp. URHB0044]